MKKVETTLRNIECTYEIKCDKQWDDLETQIASNIKFCKQCEKNVYLCKTQEELDCLRKIESNEKNKQCNFIEYAHIHCSRTKT